MADQRPAPSPAGWIITTAKHRGLDKIRRESSRDDRQAEATRLQERDDPEEVGAVVDDQLRLMFTCCHPALAPSAQVALTLRLIAGLQTPEIAQAFLVPEPTMAQRIVRAKNKIKGAKIPYRVPDEAELPARLKPVLAVLYLIFNEGYVASAGNELVRADLCAEAIKGLCDLRHLVGPKGGLAQGAPRLTRPKENSQLADRRRAVGNTTSHARAFPKGTAKHSMSRGRRVPLEHPRTPGHRRTHEPPRGRALLIASMSEDVQIDGYANVKARQNTTPMPTECRPR